MIHGDRGPVPLFKVAAGSSIHSECQLKAYIKPILIGEGVMIAANVALYSYDHGMAPDQPIRKQPLTAKGLLLYITRRGLERGP